MPNPLKITLSLLLLAFPLVEIALLIKVAGLIGFWPVLLIIAATAFAGISVIRSHGLSAFQRVVSQAGAGGSGLEPLTDTFLAVTGGMLLVSPGLISDFLGVLLQFKPVRGYVVRKVLPEFTASAFGSTPGYAPAAVKKDQRGARPHADRGAIIIEGEYERIDDEPPA